MSVLAFKPEIWSKVILAALQKNLVFGGPAVVNNDYEGEISGPGNVVHITQFSDPTISTYVPSSPITYAPLSDAGLDLNIDQAKSFSFAIDDVDKRQAAGDMMSYLEERASYKLADVADQFVAGLYTGVSTANIIGGSTAAAPLEIFPFSTGSPAAFYQQVLLPLKVALTQANIPMAGRYCVVPPFCESLLEQTQAFIAITDMQGQPSEVFQTGLIGRAAGFDIYVSNNSVNANPSFTASGVTAPSGWSGSTNFAGSYVVQAGHNMAITYGEQIVQTEALRLQTTFADGVRGLHVYGAKLVRPDAIALAYVSRNGSV